MAQQAEVFLMCGPVGSGKTSFASKLERSHNAVRFSLDEWMIRLYGQRMSRELFDERLELCKSLMLETAEKVLVVGISVVLDFGFWKRQERADMKAWLEARNISYTLYYFSASSETLWERLEARNQDLPEGMFEISREMFELFSSRFEPPAASEALNLIHIKS